jgi:hypothetical protein
MLAWFKRLKCGNVEMCWRVNNRSLVGKEARLTFSNDCSAIESSRYESHSPCIYLHIILEYEIL